MATVMRHGCGFEAEVAQHPCTSCGGFRNWTSAEVEEPDQAPPAATPDGGSAWTCARCRRDNDTARADCIECATPRAGRAVVVDGDAGRHVVAAGSALPLGRQASFSPAASALHRFENVSRRHALIRAVGGAGAGAGMTVTDLFSANGTWLVESDGVRRLPPGAEIAVEPGTTVQLGNGQQPNARLSLGVDGL